MTTEVETRRVDRVAHATGTTPEQVATIARTVARGASMDELTMFLSLAQRYDLDPFAKEIYCVCALNDDGSRKTGKDGQPIAPMIMAGRDGFLKIANRDDSYQGLVSGVVYPGEPFEMTTVVRGVEPTVEISHQMTPDKRTGSPLMAYAVVYRKGRAPQVATADWEVYGKPNARDNRGQVRSYSPWAKYPDAMLVKVAESVALRKAFSISGVVSEEETDAGREIEEGSGSFGAITDRPALRVPEVSPASRGFGRRQVAPPPPPEEPPAAGVREPAPEPPGDGPTSQEVEFTEDGQVVDEQGQPVLPVNDPRRDKEMFGTKDVGDPE